MVEDRSWGNRVVDRGKTFSLHRTLSVASTMLVERSGLNTSVSEIARLAHCSTSTIYDVFTSKEELFSQAISHGKTQRLPPPAILPEDDARSFDAVIDYLQRRLLYLSAKRSRGVFLAFLLHAKGSLKTGKRCVEEGIQIHRFSALVESAMRAGYLRRADANNVAYCISAAVSFEPLMANIVNGDTVLNSDILEQALDPFVTKKGRTILATALADLEQESDAKHGEGRERTRSWLRRAETTRK